MVDVLSDLVQPPDIDNIELVVICSTHRECADTNDECIENVVGEVNKYEAIDTTMVILSWRLIEDTNIPGETF